MPGCSSGCGCGYVKLTPEQEHYYENRRATRHRLDLRGKELHLVGKDSILEVETGLEKWWCDWQDQPDEIVVDNVLDFEELMTGKRRQTLKIAGKAILSSSCLYRSKYSMIPDGKGWIIPVFENV